MTPYRILVVDDDPTARKLFRTILEGAGEYGVLEASDGRSAREVMENHTVDLVLLDLVLPDISGADLAKEFRARPAGAEIPIIAVSALLTFADEASASTAGFTRHLAKPVEPPRLLQLVRSCLPCPDTARGQPGDSRLVLVVDDDPVQRKILATRLAHLDFRVATAVDGREGLEMARKLIPAAIVSDALMPGLDGFALCLSVRRDPALSCVPVVLFSSQYLEEADRHLGRSVGANAFVIRTPDLDEIVCELLASLKNAAPTPTGSSEALAGEHAYRMVRQLERQIALNSGLAERVGLQAKALSVVAVTSEVLTRTRDPSVVVERALAALVDGEFVTFGAVYLVEAGGGLPLRAFVGGASASRPGLADLHGRQDLLRRALEVDDLLIAPSSQLRAEDVASLLARLGISTLVLSPLRSGAQRLGVLVMGTASGGAQTEEFASFARTMRGLLAQALALAETLAENARAEAALRRSETHFRTLYESSQDAVLLQAGNQVFDCNQAALAVFGCATKQELCSKRLADLSPSEQPGGADSATLANQQIATALKLGSARFEWLYRKADTGEDFPADVLLSAMVVDARPVIQVVVRDISERKRAEAAFRESETQLRHAQKMEAVGRLAGGVAHDFNNLLTAITGYCDLALERLRDGDPLQSDLLEIQSAALRAASLTRQLLAFSRRQVLQPTVLDLNAVVSGTTRLLERLIGEDVRLTTSLDPALGRVKADSGHLEQVIMNLAVNARDAMPAGGELTITTRNADIDESRAASLGDVQPGSYVVLSISDTGCGMDEAVRAQIFEPFFTTKEPGKGTGLGLATAYGIVQQSGGHFVVHSEVGHGTRFEIYLPRIREDTPVAEQPQTRARTRGSETVLLVEDDDFVRSLVLRILEGSGYTVLVARSGNEALSVSERFDGPISLVLTDVVMPGMSGADLARRLVALRPQTKVLFISGHLAGAIAQLDQLGPNAAFLQKPFTQTGLLRKLREVLDAPAPDRVAQDEGPIPPARVV